MDMPHESWFDSRLVVRPSPIHGRGLFASRDIWAGEVVMRLGGVTMSDAEVRQQIDGGERYDGIVLDEDLNLGIRPVGWPGIYGNHSCAPNLWLAAPLEIAARRDIAMDEEVVSDYARKRRPSQEAVPAEPDAETRSSLTAGYLDRIR